MPHCAALQELMEQSLVHLAAAAGWSESEVLRVAAELESKGSKVNATPRPKVPAAVREAIKRSNQLDMELYEYAMQLFLRSFIS